MSGIFSCSQRQLPEERRQLSKCLLAAGHQVPLLAHHTNGGFPARGQMRHVDGGCAMLVEAQPTGQRLTLELGRTACGFRVNLRACASEWECGASIALQPKRA